MGMAMHSSGVHLPARDVHALKRVRADVHMDFVRTLATVMAQIDVLIWLRAPPGLDRGTLRVTCPFPAISSRVRNPACAATASTPAATVYLNISFVPLDYRVLFGNVVGLGYGMLMSYMANRARELPPARPERSSPLRRRDSDLCR